MAYQEPPAVSPQIFREPYLPPVVKEGPLGRITFATIITEQNIMDFQNRHGFRIIHPAYQLAPIEAVKFVNFIEGRYQYAYITTGQNFSQDLRWVRQQIQVDDKGSRDPATMFASMYDLIKFNGSQKFEVQKFFYDFWGHVILLNDFK